MGILNHQINMSLFTFYDILPISMQIILKKPAVENLRVDEISVALSRASLVAQLVNPPAMQETPVRFLGQEDPLEKG